MKKPFLNEITLIVDKSPLTLEEMFKLLARKGPLLIILILVLPFLQPIPIPGLSSLIAILIALQAWAYLIHHQPIVFNSWKHYLIERKKLDLIQKASQKLDPLISRFIKPRFMELTHHYVTQKISAILMIILSILLALPLPIPTSNFIPALGIFAITISHLEEDGVCLMIAYLYSGVVIGILVFTLLFLKELI